MHLLCYLIKKLCKNTTKYLLYSQDPDNMNNIFWPRQQLNNVV